MAVFDLIFFEDNCVPNNAGTHVLFLVKVLFLHMIPMDNGNHIVSFLPFFGCRFNEKDAEQKEQVNTFAD